MRSTTGDLWSFAHAQMAYLSRECLEVFPHENGALPLSYRPGADRAGFEPAASPLSVEVSREAVTGKTKLNPGKCGEPYFSALPLSYRPRWVEREGFEPPTSRLRVEVTFRSVTWKS